MSGRADEPGMDDAAVLRALAAALDAQEPVPEDARAVAVSAFDLGRLDAELAALVFDSLSDEPAVALRHEATRAARSLGFLAGGVRLDIELLDDEALLLGQIEPAVGAAVELETAIGRESTRTDDLGRFRFEDVRGSLRIRLTTDEGIVVVTPWVTW